MNSPHDQMDVMADVGQSAINDRISLRHLAYFVAVAEGGTMTSAAKRLYVSQSAVSVALGELERRLGVQLMVRHRAKGLSLTGAGRHLLPEAVTLLARADELGATLRDVGLRPAGRLVAGCFITIAPFLMPGLIDAFQQEYPQVTMELVEGAQDALQGLLLEGRCEVAVLYDVDIEPGIEYQTLYETKPYVLLPADHPLAADATVSLESLAELDMVMLDVHPSKTYFTGVLRGVGVEPVLRHRTSSFEMVRSLVARGVGYSLLIQKPPVDLSYEGRELVARPVREDVPSMPVVLAQVAGALPTRRASVFAEFCRRYVGDTVSRPAAV